MLPGGDAQHETGSEQTARRDVQGSKPRAAPRSNANEGSKKAAAPKPKARDEDCSKVRIAGGMSSSRICVSAVAACGRGLEQTGFCGNEGSGPARQSLRLQRGKRSADLRVLRNEAEQTAVRVGAASMSPAKKKLVEAARRLSAPKSRRQA